MGTTEGGIDKVKREELGPPGKLGGLGLAELKSIASTAYISTVISLLPTLKAASPALHDFFLSEMDNDTFFVDYAYHQLMFDAEWHDGSADRGVLLTPPVDL